MVNSLDVSHRWPRRLVQVVMGLAVAALVIGGVMAVGNIARDRLGPADRYLLPFAEIDCPAPPKRDRVEFLGEIQYIGEFPDRVNVLDPSLPDRLRRAFRNHRSVQNVGKISVLPPRRIEVELTFRP